MSAWNGIYEAPEGSPYGEDCPKCGGEGFVAHCWEEFACIDPEGGCDDCLEPCDICNPRPPADHSPSGRAKPKTGSVSRTLNPTSDGGREP